MKFACREDRSKGMGLDSREQYRPARTLVLRDLLCVTGVRKGPSGGAFVCFENYLYDQIDV
jgi:hypothetical protein